MIPVRDVIPSRTTPWVTVTLVVASGLVFLGQLAFAGDEPEATRFFLAWGLVPSDFSWVTAVTGLFVHSGVLHITGNLFALWIFGENVEDRLGHVRFLVFFLTTGLVAGLAQSWATPAGSTPIVGADGPVAAIMAAYLVLFGRSRVLVLVPIFVFSWEVIELPALFFMGLWFALQIVGGLAVPLSEVDARALWTPSAGFLAGLAFVWFFRRGDRLRVEWWSG
jgi:membrane associated rhomboid family serine protease